MKPIVVFSLLALILTGCAEQASDVHDSHSEEEVVNSHTIWTNDFELFVEFQPLVKGKITRFITHITQLEDYSPVSDAAVTVNLIQDKKGIRQTVDNNQSGGIFIPSLEPVNSGMHQLKIDIRLADGRTESFIMNEVYVGESDLDAKSNIAKTDDSGNISFLKEQQWRTDFQNAEVDRDTVYQVLHAGGEVLPAQGDEMALVATTSGILLYKSPGIAVGKSVNKGESLFIVSGGDLTVNNVDTDFKKAKANLEQAKANFERKQALYEEKAIAKSAFEKAQLEYEVAQSTYQSFSSNFGNGGKSIQPKFSGYIKKLQKLEGEYVNVGDVIAVITQNKRLKIETHISQNDFSQISENISANFEFHGQSYSLEELNGKLLSYGKSVDLNTPKIPIVFELDNSGAFIPGSYIETWVKTAPKADVVRIPKAALIEKYGTWSVIIQKGGESFEKRDVKIGINDGQYVEIIQGLSPEERVVTQGAYQVWMASMSGEVPAHGHSH